MDIDKDIFRAVRQEERRERISKSSAKESLDELTNEYNNIAKKYKEVTKNLQTMKDSGSIDAVEYKKLQDLKNQYSETLKQLKASREQFSQKYFLGEDNVDTLLLNAPEKGAPMFEGLAFPSEYVDSNGNATRSLDDINRELGRIEPEETRRPFKRGQGTYRRKPAGPQIGDNFFDTSGKQMVLTGTENTRAGSTMYQFVTEQGDQFYTTSLEGYKNYTGDKPIKADVARNYANKWRELQTLEGEYWNNRRNNPNWSTKDQLNFFKEKVDPVNKSLHGYKNRMEKYLGRKTGFSEFNESKYITKFAKGQKEILKDKTKTKKKNTQQQTQQTKTTTQTNEPKISDLDKTTLANLTDEEIREWAQNTSDYEEAISLRKQARKDLGMDPIETNTSGNGKNTEMNTKLNNNFKGNTANTNTNTNTNQRWKTMEQGDNIDLSTGIITKADGRKVYPDGRVFNADGTPWEPPETNTVPETRTNPEATGGPQQQPEETLDEKIKRLTEEQRKKFDEQQEAEFQQRMNEIEDEYNAEAERIDKQYKGTHSETSEDFDNTRTSGNADVDSDSGMNMKEYMKKRRAEIESRRPKTRAQKRQAQVAYARQRLKGKSGKKLVKGSKSSIKTRGMKGKKFKVKTKIKGGNLKQIIANTMISKATETVQKEVFRLHPSMFESLDEFADMTDDDIKYFVNNMFDPSEDQSLRKSTEKEWRQKRAEAQEARQKAKQAETRQKIVDNPDEWFDAANQDYINRYYGYTGDNTINGFEFKETEVNGKYNPRGGYYADTPDYKNPESYSMNEVEFEVDDNGNTKINKTGKTKDVEIEKNKKKSMRGKMRNSGKADDIFDWLKQNKIGLGEAMNVLFTIGTYKENRRQGRSVVSSAVRAAGSFVMGEMFGLWNIPIQLAAATPKLVVAGAKALYRENRKMNQAANNQVFGNATFQDTQQLATMRQSGMEMAKMAQYNLQQTLMGNEATYLHR